MVDRGYGLALDWLAHCLLPDMSWPHKTQSAQIGQIMDMLFNTI